MQTVERLIDLTVHMTPQTVSRGARDSPGPHPLEPPHWKMLGQHACEPSLNGLRRPPCVPIQFAVRYQSSLQWGSACPRWDKPRISSCGLGLIAGDTHITSYKNHVDKASLLDNRTPEFFIFRFVFVIDTGLEVGDLEWLPQLFEPCLQVFHSEQKGVRSSRCDTDNSSVTQHAE